jgi:Na+-transporting NADH:ubiquinone oxidoreductase subunit NqrC
MSVLLVILLLGVIIYGANKFISKIEKENNEPLKVQTILYPSVINPTPEIVTEYSQTPTEQVKPVSTEQTSGSPSPSDETDNTDQHDVTKEDNTEIKNSTENQ